MRFKYRSLNPLTLISQARDAYSDYVERRMCRRVEQQQVFLWWPRHIGNEYVWLERVNRKGIIATRWNLFLTERRTYIDRFEYSLREQTEKF